VTKWSSMSPILSCCFHRRSSFCHVWSPSSTVDPDFHWLQHSSLSVDQELGTERTTSSTLFIGTCTVLADGAHVPTVFCCWWFTNLLFIYLHTYLLVWLFAYCYCSWYKRWCSDADVMQERVQLAQLVWHWTVVTASLIDRWFTVKFWHRTQLLWWGIVRLSTYLS